MISFCIQVQENPRRHHPKESSKCRERKKFLDFLGRRTGRRWLCIDEQGLKTDQPG